MLALLVRALLLLLLASAASVTASGDTPDAAAFTVAFWPIDVDATLTHSHHADGSLQVSSSSSSGFFGTFSTSLTAPTKTPLHPLVQSIDIAWVPPVESSTTSSTFEELFAPSSRLVAVHSVGLHLQVTPTPAAASTAVFANVSTRDAVEANVQRILRELFPSTGSLPVFQTGFLTASLCNFHSWHSAEPMREALEPSADSSAAVLCLTSAFSFPNADAVVTAKPAPSRLPTFARADTDDATTVHDTAMTGDTERSSTEQFFARKVVDFAFEPRLAHVHVTRDSGSAAMQLTVDVLEAWVANGSSDGTDGSDTQPRLTWRQADDAAVAARYLVVTSVQRESISFFSSRAAAQKAPLVVARRDIGDLLPVSRVNVSIVGDGFHRRVAVDADVRSSAVDERVCSKLLLRVPLSHEVYADLDELRRMERFGELRLLAFAKHIEIERPSPVSPQHSIALEFPLSPLTARLHVSFPIHFRYQAPSTTALFRAASVVAPELLVFCKPPSSSPKTRERVVKSAVVDHHPQAELTSQDAAYFQWILASSSSRSSSSRASHAQPWRRVRVQYPASVRDVLTPVGVLAHGAVVSFATLAVAACGALLLVGVSLSSSRSGLRIAANASRANWRPATPAS